MGLKDILSAMAVTLTLAFTPACKAEPLEKRIPTDISVPDTHKPDIKSPDQSNLCGNEIADKIIPKEVYIVSQIQDTKIADQKPKYAKLGEQVVLKTVLKAKENGKIVYFTEAENIKIKGRKIPKQLIKKWEQACQPKIDWFKVEPTHNNYSHVSGRNPIDYAETSFAQGWKAKANVHPTHFQDQFLDSESGLGVMRYKVTLNLNGKELSTLGKNSLLYGGISKKVHKVTFRPNTGSSTDYLFELFNAPYVWGSTPYQVDNQVGVDCADLAVYALRRTGHKIKYTWSRGLLGDKKHFLRVPLDSEAKSGDILYSGRHISVLYRNNSKGIVNREDFVIHTLFHEPNVVKVKKVGSPTTILRLKK